GSEEPYATRSVYGGYYGGGNSDSYYQQTREVGTTIDLEVYASEAGYVEMFIMVEDTRARRVNLTNLGEALAVDGSFVDTVVTVKSGRTVVLGGIINRKSSQSHSGVPILSSIPILGNLFKKKSTEDDREKMLIFITPRIVNIDDPFDFAQVDNFQQMRNLQSKGATKFVDTTVDDKLLDWSNEQENEQKAIEEAVRNNRINSRNASQKEPSLQDQMDSGIIRVESKDE
ncbi:MAG: hypothetical protein JXR73_22195, partial [Candidatus Omnitrophica bacterium]|nr:hypothetical protein [Candidatus Omnitrophota bacterium]